MKKINRIFIMVLIGILIMCTLTGCWLEWGDFTFSFESRCKTTEDGFVFYLDIRNDNRLCLIELPETEEVIIPEFIDGHKVMQLGFEEIGISFRKLHMVSNDIVKTIIVQHNFESPYPDKLINLEKIIYIDILYCLTIGTDNQKIVIPRSVSHDPFCFIVNVELRKSVREIDLTGITVKTIQIPEYVTVIETGVFDGLTDVIIQTEYESKPDGWEEGWNGTCPVEWGVKF